MAVSFPVTNLLILGECWADDCRRWSGSEPALGGERALKAAPCQASDWPGKFTL